MLRVPASRSFAASTIGAPPRLLLIVHPVACSVAHDSVLAPSVKICSGLAVKSRIATSVLGGPTVITAWRNTGPSSPWQVKV